MKKFATIAALLASAAVVTPASAATFLSGAITFNGSAPTTAHSVAGGLATFQFVVDEPYAAGNPATPNVSGFSYVLNSVAVAGAPTSVNFFQSISGGMFDLVFGNGDVLQIYGFDIGSAGSVTPGNYYPPVDLTAVYVNGSADVLSGGYISATPVIPEPATWAMLLAGFGAVGVAMRRRQNVRVSFA